MLTRLATGTLALLLAAGLGACVTTGGSSQAPGVSSPSHRGVGTPGPVGESLPSSATITACAGEELSGRIIVAATPDHKVVGVMDSGTKLPMYWPTGYRAVFDPSFSRVLTDTGAVFALAGEDINAAMTTTGRWHGLIACTSLDGIWVLAPHG